MPVSGDVASLLKHATEKLRGAGIASPAADASILMAELLTENRGRIEALALLGKTLDPKKAQEYLAQVHRRMSREPLQHITGIAYFHGLKLQVGPGVFVPRPETELLAERAIALLAFNPSAIILDVGTGSGAIALAVAKRVPTAKVFAIEKHAAAHSWAEKNFEALALANAQLIQSDAMQALPELFGKVDLVLSNPPYIPETDIPADPEVADYDPQTALYSGADGLDFIRDLALRSAKWLKPGGKLLIEHTENQPAALNALLPSLGFTEVRTFQDLSLRDRFTQSTRIDYHGADL